MKKSPQPFELSNIDKILETNSQHKLSANEDVSPINPDQLSKTEHESEHSISLKRAMAEVDRLFPKVPVDNPSLQADKEAVHQTSLEDELVSSIHPDASSLFMPDLNDEVKLKVAATTVGDECSNLIVACNSPDEDDFDSVEEPVEVSGSKVSVMALGKGPERIGGIVPEPEIQVNAKSQKSHIIFASLIVPVIGVGLYAYYNPQNAMQFVELSKIELPGAQQISAVGDFLSIDNEKAQNKNVVTLQTKQDEPIKVAKLSGVPVRSSVFGVAGSKGGFAKDVKRTNGHPEPVTSAESQKQDVKQSKPIVEEIIDTSSLEISVMPERFNQETAPKTKNRIVRVIPDKDVRQPQKAVPVVTPQMIQKSVKKQKHTPIKRDLQSVQRVVQLANAGDVLDGVQMKTFINGLAKGGCVSEVLHGVFGKNKISPVFVRDLMKNMDTPC